MDKSKRTFFIIAAIVVIAVIFVFILWPGKEPVLPPNTEPTETEPSATTEPTVPTQGDGPGTGNTVPIFPTEPSETSPQQGYRPDEEMSGELPASNGAHYYNKGPVFLNVNYYLSDQVFLVSFGRYERGLGNYIYLSPSVELVTGNGSMGKNFQFVFTPSNGYVTTITDAELGDHGGYTTFVRAQDYGLPAAYESESSPGTVWYMSEDATVDGFVYIDVRVYYSHRLLATLRIYVMQDAEGSYFTLGISNLNQLEDSGFFLEERYSLEEQQLTSLMELAKKYAADKRAQHKYGGNAEALTRENFVIEWRAAGQGTYFDYVSDIASDRKLTPAEQFADAPIVAVTIRDNGGIYHPAPMTYYYAITEGESGETVYELLGVDSVDHYYLRGLYYCDYPGYSETE